MITRGYKNLFTNLIPATRISNWVKQDPIIDYLDLITENNFVLDDDLKITKKRTRNELNNNDNMPNKKIKTSSDFIFESGVLFESNIIMQIENMMKNNKEYNKLLKIDKFNINSAYLDTINNLLTNKYSIILGGVLINKKNNTWGKPDMIVNGEWINKYIETEIPNILKNKWYIIDIKSSTINLISGGDEMSSKMLYNTYKSQIYIYTDALNESLKKYNINNDVNYGFILGKKYKYVVNKNIIIKKPFEYLGIVDFTKNINEQPLNNIISDAINWNIELRKNWKKYTLNPINKDELYPNMKNYYDKNWHKIKKNIAIVNKEITLLWNCGITNKKLAWNSGIKKYDDNRLNSKILGFEGKSKETIISSMLKILHTQKKYFLNKNNDHMEWQTKSDFEFFVDFETYSSDMVWDENNEWEDSFTSVQKIYMIGVIYIFNKKIYHKSFIIKYDNLDLKEEIKNKNIQFIDCVICLDELDLIKKFSKFIMNFKPPRMNVELYKKNIRLCHWSSAEPTMFNKKIKEHNLNKSNYEFNWFDLLDIFRHDRYPIIIKGCFSFGLKDIIKKMCEHKLIDLTWSELDDGLLSSFIARDIYMNLNTQQNIKMCEIIEYNFFDCKALYLLLNWMRKVVN